MVAKQVEQLLLGDLIIWEIFIFFSLDAIFFVFALLVSCWSIFFGARSEAGKQEKGQTVN